MSKRERIFLLLFLGGLLIYGGNWAYTNLVQARFEEKQKSIQRAKRSTAKQQKLVAQSRAAQLQLAKWKNMSLPRDPNRAIPQYQAFLLDLLKQCGFADPVISPGSPQLRENTYWRLVFNVHARGTMSALVTFLEGFYGLRLLHKVTNLTLTPLSAGKSEQLVDVRMTVEALALLVEPGGGGGGSGSGTQPLLARNLLMARGPGPQADPDELVNQLYLTGTIVTKGRSEALFYNRANGQSMTLRVGERLQVGNLAAEIIEISTKDIVLQIGNEWCTLELGENLGRRQTLSPAAALAREIQRIRHNSLQPNM